VDRAEDLYRGKLNEGLKEDSDSCKCKEQLKLEKILGPEKKRKRLLLEKAVPEGKHHLLFQLLRRKEFLFLLKVPGREDLQVSLNRISNGR
jgi:hypothetical protein